MQKIGRLGMSLLRVFAPLREERQEEEFSLLVTSSVKHLLPIGTGILTELEIGTLP